MNRWIVAQYFWYLTAMFNAFGMGMHLQMFSSGKGDRFILFVAMGAFVVLMSLSDAFDAEDRRKWLSV